MSVRAHSGVRRLRRPWRGLGALTVALGLGLVLGGCAVTSPSAAARPPVPIESARPSESPSVTVPADLEFRLESTEVSVVLDPPAPPPESGISVGRQQSVGQPAALAPAESSPGFARRPTAASPAAGPGEVVTVYMAPSPAGDDSHGGVDAGDPILSLARAQEVARVLSAPNLDVRIRAGEYHQAPTTWSLAAPGGRIRFLPESEIEGAPVPSDQQARFVGDGLAGPYWLDIVASTTGGSTAFDVRNLRVSGYANGLRISTGYDNDPGPVPGRLASGFGEPLRAGVVTGMIFTRVGSVFAATKGYAAVHLQNTAGAIVRGNTFDQIENGGSSGGLIHGVYAVVSSGLEVSGNEFDRVSGDAIRTRHRTSGTIVNNFISRSGRYGAVSDWFCGRSCAAKAGTAVECPSGVLAVHDNAVGLAYGGGRLPEFTRTVADSEADGGCP